MQMNQNPTVKSGRRSRVSTEQKLAILQQWQAGTPVVELCRTHSLKANAIYRWKKQLDHGLRDHGEIIPKSRLLPASRIAGRMPVTSIEFADTVLVAIQGFNHLPRHAP
jgi:transposase-like protein